MATVKTWVWSGKGPRHQNLNGETVKVFDVFSNGMQYPGDSIGGVKNNAGCKCTLNVHDDGEKPKKKVHKEGAQAEQNLVASGPKIDAPKYLKLEDLTESQAYPRRWQQDALYREDVQKALVNDSITTAAEGLDALMAPAKTDVLLHTRMSKVDLENLISNASTVEKRYIRATAQVDEDLWNTLALPEGVHVELQVARGTGNLAYGRVQKLSDKDLVTQEEILLARGNSVTVVRDFTDEFGVRRVTLDVRKDVKVAVEDLLPPPTTQAAELQGNGPTLKQSLNQSIEIEEPPLPRSIYNETNAAKQDAALARWESRRVQMIQRYSKFKSEGKLPQVLVKKYEYSIGKYAGSPFYKDVQDSILELGKGAAAKVENLKAVTAADDILELFHEVPALQSDWVAWRGLNISESSLSPGAIIENKALTSVTVDSNVASMHATMTKAFESKAGNQVILRMVVPKGTKAINIDANFTKTTAGREGELILRPGTDFKVTGKIGTIERDGVKIPVYGVNITSAESRVAALAEVAAPISTETLGFLKDKGYYSQDDFTAMHKEVLKKNQAWGNSLSSGEKNAISTYQGSSYQSINRWLRGIDVPSNKVGWMKGTVKQLDAALERAVHKHTTIVHRGYGRSSPDALMRKFGTSDPAKMVGRVVTEDGYMSTTLDARVTGSFGNVRMEIEIPPGAPAGYLPATSTGKYYSEYEVLLPRGTKLEIIEAKPVPGEHILNLRARVVVDDAVAPSPTIPGVPAKMRTSQDTLLDKEEMVFGSDGSQLAVEHVEWYKGQVEEAVGAMKTLASDFTYSAGVPSSATVDIKVFNKTQYWINMQKSAIKKQQWDAAEAYGEEIVQGLDKLSWTLTHNKPPVIGKPVYSASWEEVGAMEANEASVYVNSHFQYVQTQLDELAGTLDDGAAFLKAKQKLQVAEESIDAGDLANVDAFISDAQKIMDDAVKKAAASKIPKMPAASSPEAEAVYDEIQSMYEKQILVNDYMSMAEKDLVLKRLSRAQELMEEGKIPNAQVILKQINKDLEGFDLLKAADELGIDLKLPKPMSKPKLSKSAQENKDHLYAQMEDELESPHIDMAGDYVDDVHSLLTKLDDSFDTGVVDSDQYLQSTKKLNDVMYAMAEGDASLAAEEIYAAKKKIFKFIGEKLPANTKLEQAGLEAKLTANSVKLISKDWDLPPAYAQKVNDMIDEAIYIADTDAVKAHAILDDVMKFKPYNPDGTVKIKPLFHGVQGSTFKVGEKVNISFPQRAKKPTKTQQVDAKINAALDLDDAASTMDELQSLAAKKNAQQIKKISNLPDTPEIEKILENMYETGDILVVEKANLSPGAFKKVNQLMEDALNKLGEGNIPSARGKIQAARNLLTKELAKASKPAGANVPNFMHLQLDEQVAQWRKHVDNWPIPSSSRTKIHKELNLIQDHIDHGLDGVAIGKLEKLAQLAQQMV